MRVNKIDDDKLFIKVLPYTSKLVYEIGLATGLRISDILTLKKAVLEKKEPVIREQKTGKSKRIYIPKKLKKELIRLAQDSPNDYIFGSTRSKEGHVCRQAVYKQFKKAGLYAGIHYNIGTHSMRKKYAWKVYESKGLRETQVKLNHSTVADTALYLLDSKNEK